MWAACCTATSKGQNVLLDDFGEVIVNDRFQFLDGNWLDEICYEAGLCRLQTMG